MRARERDSRIVRGLLTAMMMITVSFWALPASADPAPADTSTTDASLAGGRLALRTSWSEILSHSVNLGPSEAGDVGVIAQLRTDTAPVLLEQWAAVRGLAVTWDPGDDWADVTGGAAPLGRALGLAIDEFRAPTGTGSTPPPLRHTRRRRRWQLWALSARMAASRPSMSRAVGCPRRNSARPMTPHL